MVALTILFILTGLGLCVALIYFILTPVENDKEIHLKKTRYTAEGYRKQAYEPEFMDFLRAYQLYQKDLFEKRYYGRKILLGRIDDDRLD